MSTESLIFNGIDGSTGKYLPGPATRTEFATRVLDYQSNPEEQKDAADRRTRDKTGNTMGPIEGINPKELFQTGWGVIFPANLESRQLEALKVALQPLLQHRQKLAAEKKEHYYKEYSGEMGYLGETKREFLAKQGASSGAADPENVPYYLLIVGSPEAIPYSFQYQLDVEYAVGRIHFTKLEDYYHYARSVVEAEKANENNHGQLRLPRQAAFFGVDVQDDIATSLSAEYLVGPLADFIQKDQPGWQVELLRKSNAYRSNLEALLHRETPPALLFTATHGMSFPNGDDRQARHQGALLCQDWPGPKQHQGPVPEEYFFSGEHVDSQANLLGMIAFCFACFSAGTPRLDSFSYSLLNQEKEIARQPFLSSLSRRLLSHNRGGALAVVGHIDRAWGYSFYLDGEGKDVITFQETLKRLLEGHPIGSALEPFNKLYAQHSTDLVEELERSNTEFYNEKSLTRLWTATNDARNYSVIGDPAVKLIAGESPSNLEIRQSIIEIISPVSEEVRVLSDAFAPEAVQKKLVNQQNDKSAIVSKPSPSSAAMDYGLWENFKQAQSSIGQSLQSFANKLGDFLGKALEDAASLEIATYVSKDMNAVKYDKEIGGFTGASLRAKTYIKIDGDTFLCMPEVNGEIDTDVWKIHMEAVRQAQESRSELLKAAINAATDLVNLLKP